MTNGLDCIYVEYTHDNGTIEHNIFGSMSEAIAEARSFMAEDWAKSVAVTDAQGNTLFEL